MKLTDGEKLIVLMLCGLYEKFNVESELDPSFIESAIYSDNTWGIGWRYNGIPFESESAPHLVSDVVEILDMWSFIEDSYSHLTPEDQALVEEKAHPFGKDPKFRGFDGNNEASYMSIARFLIKELGRFQKFDERELNSHMPSIDVYERMQRVFEPMRRELMGNLLSAGQLIEILGEMVHPNNR